MKLSEMSGSPVWFVPPAFLKNLNWSIAANGDKLITTLLIVEGRDNKGDKMVITLCQSGNKHHDKASFHVLPLSFSSIGFSLAHDGPPQTSHSGSPNYWLTEEQAKTLVQRQDGAWQ